MNIIIFLVLGVATFFIVTNLLIRLSSKKTIKTIKNEFLEKDINTILKNLSKIERIIEHQVIENKEYLVVLTPSRETMKIYEFENGLCSAFFVQTLELAYSLPEELNYEKEFNVVDNDNFEQGIDITIVFRQYVSTFFHNGLTVEITPKRYAKIFRSIQHTPSLKTKPICIYVVSISVSNIDYFIDFIEKDTLNVIQHFKKDKLG